MLVPGTTESQAACWTALDNITYIQRLVVSKLRADLHRQTPGAPHAYNRTSHTHHVRHYHDFRRHSRRQGAPLSSPPALAEDVFLAAHPRIQKAGFVKASSREREFFVSRRRSRLRVFGVPGGGAAGVGPTSTHLRRLPRADCGSRAQKQRVFVQRTKRAIYVLRDAR